MSPDTLTDQLSLFLDVLPGAFPPPRAATR
jgi:hypothetical protein